MKLTSKSILMEFFQIHYERSHQYRRPSEWTVFFLEIVNVGDLHSERE